VVTPLATPTLTAYFDTNVYDEIYKGKVAPNVLVALGKAIGRGQIRVLLSETVLEELAAMVGSDPEGAAGQASLAATIGSWHDPGLIKDHWELLTESIAAIERGIEPPSKFKPGDLVGDLLAKLANPDPSSVARFLSTLKKQKTEFRETNRKTAAGMRDRLRSFPKNSRPSFDQFWQWMTAQNLSSVLGGAAGQLSMAQASRCPVLLACSGIAASLMYAEVVEGRASKPGDSRDMHHAVVATAADVFVTSDCKFARRLGRIPGLSFRVCSVPEFVNLLDR
jgi:hypothetical protein